MANQIILFRDSNFHGAHKHIFDSEENLNASDDNSFNDRVSSLVILGGNWQFFRDSGLQNPYPVILGPGLYRSVSSFQIKNDDLSSLTSVTDPPTMSGEPLTAHAILFEHEKFHGDHRHVFADERNLDDNDFNDVTSSIVVEQGNWSLFRNSGFDTGYPPVLGPGIYPSVVEIGITNDDLSSLQPTDAAPTVSNAVEDELILFQNTNFHGAHKHVFAPEPTLDASDDNFFNDRVSSLVVLLGNWSFFADSDFLSPYPPSLAPGTFPNVADQGIKNDDMSSLRPTISIGVLPGSLILFRHTDFHGPHKHVFDSEVNLDADANNNFSDSVSSLVILSGNWRFFRDEGFTTPYPVVLGPGLYRSVSSFQMENDDMSSLITVSDRPTMSGEPLNGHIVLFEHKDFHGDHRHVFTGEPDLRSNAFNDMTSSIVVEQGNWSLFRNSGFDTAYPPVLGPGIYPSVFEIGITNDDLSSLQPTDAVPTVSNSVDSEILLFQDSKFHGAHKHVFSAEPNLAAADDNFFNDRASSLVVLLGNWSFFGDANFVTPFTATLDPGRYPSVTDQSLPNDQISSLRPTVPTPVIGGDAIQGHIILFEHTGFRGRHRHILNAEENLNASEDSSLNDRVSSLVVVSGNWQLFRDSGFHQAYPPILGPGLYSSVADVDVRNDDLSSLQVVDQDATVTGKPLDAHVVLFEHNNFHGAHRHIVSIETDLNAEDDSFFNDKVSSMVVLNGNWDTFADSDFGGQYPPIVGPGRYPSVQEIGIINDDMSSLQPSGLEPTVTGPTVTSHIVLFEHVSLRGAHKHVFAEEENLNAEDDRAFNDAVSSAAVLLDQWRIFRDSHLQRQYDVILDSGLFPRVAEVGITNDDLSSLSPAGLPIVFDGKVTLQVDSSDLKDPVTLTVKFTLLFFADTRLLLLPSFPDLSVSGVGAHFNGAGRGSLPVDGALSLPDLNFHFDLPFVSDSDARFSLSTGAVSSPKGKFNLMGSPADATGHLVIVGADAFRNGHLEDDDFSVLLDGTIAPWPV